ncbi:M55 family metallopeptidase [candidate division KSB1 bacterium]
MKKYLILVLLILPVVFSGFHTPQADLKVFISVDMEGLAGVVSGSECGSGPDYNYFREIMTLETNAAIEGAINAGATEIVVRDGHGGKTNIFPGILHPKAKLLRGNSGHIKNMMDGIDDTFDALMFIGYHAKAGTPNGILAHTSTGNVIDFSVNGVSLPEAGYNALIAGMYDVPVVFLAGDRAICEQAKELFGDIELVETKIGIGKAELGLHPKVVRELVREGVSKALRNLDKYKPYKLQPPYRMMLQVRSEKPPYPGAEKIEQGTFSYTSSDMLKIIDAFNKMK